MAGIKRLGVLQRYLLTNPLDEDTIKEVRSLVDLLAGDGKEVTTANAAGKPEALFDHAARTGGMNWLEKRAAADLEFRKAVTWSRNHPGIISKFA
jgi:hypothetical protein